MWVVACQDGDADADWIAARLREHGLEPLHVLTSSALVHQTVWEHRIGADGVRTILRLEDGRVVDSAEVHGLLNRLVWLSADGYRGATARDREYAGVELHALALSWLEGMGPLALNRPTAVGLAGAWRPAPHWRWRAHAAGLASADYRSPNGAPDPVSDPTDVHAVLVVDGEAIVDEPEGPGPEFDIPSLAALVDLDIFEAAFRERDEGEWELLDVNAVPLLWTRGDAAADAVAAALRRRSEIDDPALRHSH